MNIFILEDSEERFSIFDLLREKHELTVAKTAQQAIELLLNHSFDLIFLDHDLDEGNTGINGEGIDVAHWMADNADRFEECEVVVHSMNHVGAANMISVLQRVNIACGYRPFSSYPFNQIIQVLST